MLDLFPHLTENEFDKACVAIHNRFRSIDQKQSMQTAWLSVEIKQYFSTKYLQINRVLSAYPVLEDNVRTQERQIIQDETDHEEIQEHDDEIIDQPLKSQTLLNYDIFLSPTYRVPVLYISVSDPEHRYPPTMTTLYRHVVPPEYRAETESVGVIGGITITDHPVTNSPVFFVHPCQTAEVMEASVGKRDVSAEEYLLMWMGALGKCVGLDVPMSLMEKDISTWVALSGILQSSCCTAK